MTKIDNSGFDKGVATFFVYLMVALTVAIPGYYAWLIWSAHQAQTITVTFH